MKHAVAAFLFFCWLAARFEFFEGGFFEGFKGDYNKGYEEGLKIGHLQGVVEGLDAGHLLGYEEGQKIAKSGCNGFEEGKSEGYGEGFFAGVHKGFECKMRQIDAFNFEC
jgi:hypothetical protein